MEKILAENAALDNTLLKVDEEQYDKQAQTLVSKLQKLSSQDLNADSLLDRINSSQQTLTYLYVLYSRFLTTTSTGKTVSRQLPPSLLPNGLLWPYITQILLEFDVIQVRYAPEYFLKTVSVVAQGAEETSNLIPAITLLHHVILRLDASSSTYTSIHHTFVRLCLLAQAFSEAISLLDLPIYHIPAETDRLSLLRTSRHLCSPQVSSAMFLTERISTRGYLEYNLMAGMCYLALHQLSKAQFFFEVVLTTPAAQNVASLVMIEAYKKWLLVGLLIHGDVPATPKAANQTALKLIRTIAKPYDCVAEAFKTPYIVRLRAEIEEATDIWEQDGNYGLILEVYQAHRKFAISRLGNTFAALSIAEVARRVAPDQNMIEIRNYIEGLILSGDLSAVVMRSTDNSGDILRFLPSFSSTKTELQVEQDLAAQTRELKVLLKRITDIDQRLESTGDYIDYLKRLKKVKDEDRKSGGKSGLTVEEVDEDMMEEY